MTAFMTKLIKEENGAAIVEYGLALLVVASLAVTAFSYLGGQTDENVTGACTALGSADCDPSDVTPVQ